MQNRNHTSDVLIIGQGIAGAALALFLQRAGIDSAICEARPSNENAEGYFLYLAPNGMNVLRDLDLGAATRDGAIHTTGIEFYNRRGRRIAAMDNSGDTAAYGAAGVVLKRARLHRVLRDTVRDRAIPVHTNAKLVHLEQRSDAVEARFADGTTRSAALVIGADGIHSRTRSAALPDAPAPAYVGLVDSGGFASVPHLRDMVGPQRMVFGRRAFFSYTVHPSGEVYWFSNVPVATEPERGTLERIGAEGWHAHLLHLHEGDPEPIREIIGRTPPHAVDKWPLRDLPTLPRWHAERVCLVGDAAHATSPSSGQGASLALESAMMLAKCLRDEPDHQSAFQRFEASRRPRVEDVIAQARRNGNHKIPNPVAGVVRDMLLPVFLRLGAREARRTHGHRIRWHDTRPRARNEQRDSTTGLREMEA